MLSHVGGQSGRLLRQWRPLTPIIAGAPSTFFAHSGSTALPWLGALLRALPVIGLDKVAVLLIVSPSHKVGVPVIVPELAIVYFEEVDLILLGHACILILFFTILIFLAICWTWWWGLSFLFFIFFWWSLFLFFFWLFFGVFGCFLLFLLTIILLFWFLLFISLFIFLLIFCTIIAWFFIFWWIIFFIFFKCFFS